MDRGAALASAYWFVLRCGRGAARRRLGAAGATTPTCATSERPGPWRPGALRADSAVAQLGALVEQLAARRDERLVLGATHRADLERGYPVAVLEGELHAEVALQPTADRVGGERAQELAALRLARRRNAVVGERRAAPLHATGHLADDLPRVGQRRPHALDERVVVDLSPFSTLE